MIVNLNPFLGKLRDDPRFQEIVEAQKKVYDGLVKEYATWKMATSPSRPFPPMS